MVKISFRSIADDVWTSNVIIKAFPHLQEIDIVSQDDKIRFRKEVAKCIGGDYNPYTEVIHLSQEDYLMYLLKYRNYK